MFGGPVASAPAVKKQPPSLPLFRGVPAPNTVAALPALRGPTPLVLDPSGIASAPLDASRNLLSTVAEPTTWRDLLPYLKLQS
ncbi:hypothetical protein L227DRAFT_612088 [Lentinus tigrinus ALCF2SS1-6]|uniref:Uncharacterized protein n=1 Tax=Lentinus tigrinus ALCF2SS1-6 TaxID=1328759 RepID=A0A5C2S8X3_9APHY|nr:hypothetical protein L227DRAFT_612088 [Lentinus tigrinus ALCF2SS1-6]